jgi:hypothetical protein
MEYENQDLNTLLTPTQFSDSVKPTLSALRERFDSNYETWESLPTGDPQRKELRVENEKLINLILNGR